MDVNGGEGDWRGILWRLQDWKFYRECGPWGTAGSSSTHPLNNTAQNGPTSSAAFEDAYPSPQRISILFFYYLVNKFKYWLGESRILILLIITTAIYFTQGIIRKNCKTCNNKNWNINENQEEVELQPLSVVNQANTEEIHPQRRVLTIPTTNVRIA